MICHWFVDNNTAEKELTGVQEKGWTFLHMSACWLILHGVANCVAHLYKQHTAHIVVFVIHVQVLIQYHNTLLSSVLR